MSALRRILGWCVCAGAFLTYVGALLTLGALGTRPARGRSASSDRRLCLLLTGRFDSQNWGRSHILPLARAGCVSRVIAVVDGPVITHPKIHQCHPPRWLRRLLGRSPTRSLWVLWSALRHRPDVVIGYHFFPAALSALLAARIVRATALYSMTAGPVELMGGGVATESPLVRRSSRLATLLELPALRLCRCFDVIVVRGRRARQYLLQRQAAQNVAIIPGSIDPGRFATPDRRRDYDVLFAGRLVPVKQPEQFVHIVALLSRRRPTLRAAVVGSGPLMSALQEQADSLRLNGALDFLGHVENVEDVLKRGRIFTLTSRSEGLSIALAEAMLAGAVPVVADVGDLGELVHDGVTGWRIQPNHIDGYVDKIEALLQDAETWERLSHAARTRAHENNALEAVTRRWEQVLPTAPAEPRAPAPGRSSSLLPTPALDSVGRLWSNTSYRYWQDRTPAWLKQAVVAPLRMIPTTWLLGHRFAATLRLAARAERWSVERARKYRLAQLRRICALAYAHSPYYRAVFDAAGFDPDDLRRPEDLAGLPTIDRDTLREHLSEMCTVPPHAPGVDAVSTGGTGGVPLHFHMRADRAPIEYAYLVASWSRARYRLGMPLAVFRGKLVRPDRSGLYHDYEPLLCHHFYSVFHMSEANMRRYLEDVARLGPCFLHVYPSTVAALARFVQRSGMHPPGNVLGVIAESEIVYPQQRQMVEEVFGCRYFSCYGHSEKLVLAAECEHSTDYHIWPTYGYVELLDDAGRSVTTPGQSGEIVATGFINTVVPFIRYRTGDRATYVGDRCSACGREHTLIRDVRGHRTQEVLIAVDGSEIPWTALNTHDDTFLRVRQFQFCQQAPGQAVLRVVPAEGFSGADCERIVRNLMRKLNGRLHIVIEPTHSIQLSQRGKAIYVDQRITPLPHPLPARDAHTPSLT